MEGNLKFFAEACDISYKSREEIESLGYLFFSEDNTQFIIFYKESQMIIVIRGSNDFKDFLDDINITKDKFYSITGVYCGKIHKGFINHYRNIQEKILNYVLKFQENPKENKEIIFCGHSLGGMCAIAALDASFLPNSPPIKVFTFGSPRIGDKEFVKIFNSRIDESIRVVNQFDPITFIPLPIRFRHLPVEKKLKTKLSFKRLLVKIKSLFSRIEVATGDHDIQEYIRKLETK